MFTNIRKIRRAILPAFLFLASFSVGYAQRTDVPPTASIKNPVKADSIEELIGQILDAVFDIGIILAVFFIIYAGFLFVIAQGNEEKLRKAKLTILWTVVGVAVLLGARVIAGMVCGTIDQLRDIPKGCQEVRADIYLPFHNL